MLADKLITFWRDLLLIVSVIKLFGILLIGSTFSRYDLNVFIVIFNEQNRIKVHLI